MKIVILNWRSINDPLSGGAEVATFENARRWVSLFNAKVFWISPPPQFNCKNECVEGVYFEYVGLPLCRNVLKLLVLYPIMYVCTWAHVIMSHRNLDVVVDQSHGLPYLTPLFFGKRSVLYIHEVAGAIWHRMYKSVIALIGEFMELHALRYYKKNSIITVSESSKSELMALGLRNISVVHNGVSMEFPKNPWQKYSIPTILFLNRLVKMKNPEHAIEALSIVLRVIPNVRLILSGKVEPNRKVELLSYIDKMQVNEHVELTYIPDSLKAEYMGRSHVYINPSLKEGWGLGNLEANSQGTMVVAYKGGGNSESIKDGVNGYLTERTPQALAQKLIHVLQGNLIPSQQCIDYARKFSWDESAKSFYSILEGIEK